jgi:hypothetical protein
MEAFKSRCCNNAIVWDLIDPGFAKLLFLTQPGVSEVLNKLLVS